MNRSDKATENQFGYKNDHSITDQVMRVMENFHTTKAGKLKITQQMSPKRLTRIII